MHALISYFKIKCRHALSLEDRLVGLVPAAQSNLGHRLSRTHAATLRCKRGGWETGSLIKPQLADSACRISFFEISIRTLLLDYICYQLRYPRRVSAFGNPPCELEKKKDQDHTFCFVLVHTSLFSDFLFSPTQRYGCIMLCDRSMLPIQKLCPTYFQIIDVTCPLIPVEHGRVHAAWNP